MKASSKIAVYGPPAVLGGITLCGLLAALLLGELGAYLSWPTVGLPIIVVIWAMRKK